jgi:hypothetical protein
MSVLPQITPFQSRILCMTSTFFYVPFLFTIYRRVVKQGYYGNGHTRIITVGQWLGVLSLITGTCSMLYWQNQSHDSWRYYLVLTMAKVSGVTFFICGYRYITGSYRRIWGYTLCGSTLGFYHLSNSWYLQGSPYWVVCHGLMHFFTCCCQTYTIHMMVEPYADNPCMTDIENVVVDKKIM